MAKNSITDYDNTSGNNTDVQSVDISEGCSPSGINNAIREIMADLADVNDGTVALTSPQMGSLNVTGNVGIGVTPTSMLHVKPVDETNFRVFNEGSNLILASETNSGRDNNRGMDIESSLTRFVISGSEKMRINSSGSVAIGTSSPISQSKLTVAGNSLSVTGSDGNFSAGGQRAFMDIASGKVRIGGVGGGGAGTTLGLYVGTGTEAATLDASGNVTINTGGLQAIGVYNNTTGSGANLVVDSAGGFARSTSSQRYKNTINDATHGLTELLTLRPVTYKHTNDGDTIYGGLIAEEVHTAGLTEFVQYSEDDNGDDQPEALYYGNMVSLCIKAIQEQQATITALEARIAALEAN